jgi:transcriptional regulator with XRE-family HTH domain
MSLSQHYIREPSFDKQSSKDNINFNKAVGNLLQKARVSANMTQEEVGTELELSQDIVSRHEKGAAVSAFRLRQFARLYAKPISFFYMADITSKVD